MVLLSCIYTRTGDAGTTAIGTGRRLPKDHPRIEACGDVDELNAVLGLARAEGARGAAARLLRNIQNDLFDLGADLTIPGDRGTGAAGAQRRGAAARRRAAGPVLRITAAQATRLEREIDRANAGLGVLRSFVLPGGTRGAAWLHLARTVCRRAERRVVALARREPVNPQAIIYLNRLSDLLFVLARRANGGGRRDVLWAPGGGARRRR
jgi:cob(I)alamin adenosyltransferase